MISLTHFSPQSSQSPPLPNPHSIRPDAAFPGEFTIEPGCWEAKDQGDDLEAEIKKKIKRGYRLRSMHLARG